MYINNWNRSGAAMSRLLGVLCILAGVSYSSALSCLSCESEAHFRDCSSFTTCGVDESCYIEKYLNNVYQPRYRAGCRTNTVCSLIGRRDTTICTECCHTDNCNSDGCGQHNSVATTVSSNLKCYKCDVVRPGEVCSRSTVCYADELCISQYKSDGTSFYYKLGCYKEAVCNILPAGGDTRCCSTDLCNSNAATVPPTTTRPTTPTSKPTTTTPKPTTTTPKPITTTPKPSTTTPKLSTTTPKPTTTTPKPTTTTTTPKPSTTTPKPTTTTPKPTTTTPRPSTTTPRPSTTTPKPSTTTPKPTTTTLKPSTTTPKPTTTTPKPTTTTPKPTATTPKPTTTTPKPTTPTPKPTTTTPKPTTTTPKPTTTTPKPFTTTPKPTTTTPKPTTTTPKPTTTTPKPTTTHFTPTKTVAETTTHALVGPNGDSSRQCFTCLGDKDICELAYVPSTCASPNNYCLNTITNSGDGSRLVERRCATFDECYTKWWQVSAKMKTCIDFNGMPLFTDFECSYCCTDDFCNDSLQPISVYKGS